MRAPCGEDGLVKRVVDGRVAAGTTILATLERGHDLMREFSLSWCAGSRQPYAVLYHDPARSNGQHRGPAS